MSVVACGVMRRLRSRTIAQPYPLRKSAALEEGKGRLVLRGRGLEAACWARRGLLGLRLRKGTCILRIAYPHNR